MSNEKLLSYHQYCGSFVRKSDQHIFNEIMLTFPIESLKKILILTDNSPNNIYEEIVLKELFIPHADFDDFMKHQIYEEKRENVITSQTHINRLHFSCFLKDVNNDPAIVHLNISSVQLRLDSAKPIFTDDYVVFEDIEAIILGNCIFREGGLQ